MSISLHHALVPTWIQMLEALDGLIDKAAGHCAEIGMDDEGLCSQKLAPDMFDFAYQVQSATSHSIGAIEGVREGVYSPDLNAPPRSFAEMKQVIADTLSQLEELDPSELDGFIGKKMEFRFKEFVIPFVAEEFLLSFSQPNFFFHVTTAYALLRAMGVEIGKRDYMGALRTMPI
ncbi:DUF1993 domain-containing protein [Croceicoccus mobilis]|uniref:DUF1993 domain-containing protein n=1 Tax=Croceicoccus mobilis TaxID=1703339 RepID=A0A917DWN1_9SPHN|nr:DUF1993 domain-containing protein [Croceicoccus mobilis]GGD77458.1 hypothetical protein GCM10010990_28980 [Croceicoccus mobilis]